MSETRALDDKDKQWLLALARRTLEHMKPSGSKTPDEKTLTGGAIPPAALPPRGAFVTLHEAAGGELRGCIGYVAPVEPLYRAVIENAVNAARRDPRFPAVRPDEVAGLRIEISAMTPPREIRDIEEIEVGRDGLIVERGGARGLLLPQVASERGWDRETFLDHTCGKAGLPHSAWREGNVTIEAFSADVFSD